MIRKFEISHNYLRKYLYLFRCPICHSTLQFNSKTLSCLNHHSFDLNKKGTVCLIKTSNLKVSKTYNENLFRNRKRFIQKDFYNDIYNSIANVINKEFKNQKINILDLGCGEGTHAMKILSKLENTNYIGMDYSKIAINMATDYMDNEKYFLVSDINNVPFASQSFDVILDFLSPYCETEVKRLLKKNGIFIKIVPGNKYLYELRKELNLEYKKDERKFMNRFHLKDSLEVCSEFNIDKKEREYIVNMTPVSEELKNQEFHFEKITLNMWVYVMEVKNEKI